MGVNAVCEDLLGTKIAENMPLMSAGIDSVMASEFTNTISSLFSM